MSTLFRLALVSVCLVAGAAPAATQPLAGAGGERAGAHVHGEATPPAEVRTLGRARTYSLVGTLVPVGAGVGLMVNNASDDAVLAGALLALVGGVVGPSTGHFYLGDGRRAWIGIGVRGAGVGAGVLVGSLAAQSDPGWFAGAGEFVVVSGVALLVGGAYSFATLDDAARERGIAITPTVNADGRPALAIAVRLHAPRLE